MQIISVTGPGGEVPDYKLLTSISTESPLTWPHICQFWYTTALFRPVIVNQNVRKFATK